MKLLAYVSARRMRRLIPAFLALVSIALAPQALAARSFYMSFFTEGHNRQHASLSYEYADIHYFWFGANLPQPKGQSILALDFMYDDLDPMSDGFADEVKRRLMARQYDWSRIAAVLIDEPYLARIPGGATRDVWSRPCASRFNWIRRDKRTPSIAGTATLLRKISEVVKATWPKTLFWVNFSEPEIQWMMAGGACGQPIYASYLDVISLDKYQVPFDNGGALPAPGKAGSSIRPYYDWLIDKRLTRNQKVALVPGVFHVIPPNAARPTDPAVTAQWLDGFFDYANRTNGGCTIDLQMRNGRSEGCRVWLVMGYRAGVIRIPDEDWAGLFEPSADPILRRWKSELGSRGDASSDAPPGDSGTRNP